MVLDEESVLSSVISTFDVQGLRLRNLQKREPTLEDVFVALVGARMEEVEDAVTPES
jgi:ABC-2 type transport system ATP-binding protein